MWGKFPVNKARAACATPQLDSRFLLFCCDMSISGKKKQWGALRILCFFLPKVLDASRVERAMPPRRWAAG